MNNYVWHELLRVTWTATCYMNCYMWHELLRTYNVNCYVMNKTTREIIKDISLEIISASFQFFFIFRQSILQTFYRKWIELTLDKQNCIHDTGARKLFLTRKRKFNKKPENILNHINKIVISRYKVQLSWRDHL